MALGVYLSDCRSGATLTIPFIAYDTQLPIMSVAKLIDGCGLFIHRQGSDVLEER